MEHLEAIYGSEKHWLYVATMHNLALMYEAAGRYKQAHDSMQHVVKLRLQVGMVHTCVARPVISTRLYNNTHFYPCRCLGLAASCMPTACSLWPRSHAR